MQIHICRVERFIKAFEFIVEISYKSDKVHNKIFAGLVIESCGLSETVADQRNNRVIFLRQFMV